MAAHVQEANDSRRQAIAIARRTTQQCTGHIISGVWILSKGEKVKKKKEGKEFIQSASAEDASAQHPATPGSGRGCSFPFFCPRFLLYWRLYQEGGGLYAP